MARADSAEEVVIVGGGQAGLSVSYELSQRGVSHLVLERGRVGQTWRGRWDSFCLVLPNWTLQLPGHHYNGDQPDAFMPRDDIVRYLEGYASKTSGQIREGVEVSSLDAVDSGGFLLRTNQGDIQAKKVVLATGAYQKPHRPPGAESLPAGIHVIDAEGYSNPDGLPDGAVLVVGSGQTGCQIAEELREAGRETYLACGKTPWAPRRIGGRDLVATLIDIGFFEMTLGNLPSPAGRLMGNPQASGKGGGHDLNYRTLQAIGVQLLGRFTSRRFKGRALCGRPRRVGGFRRCTLLRRPNRARGTLPQQRARHAGDARPATVRCFCARDRRVVAARSDRFHVRFPA
jgi:putative flavoprotein involved in K+ transport